MAESPDIVNIFKDKPDAVIYPSDKYPPWLFDMIKEPYVPEDVMMHLYRGERIPDGKEQWTLAKGFRRRFLVMQNKMIKEDWENESDDDEGEDVG